MRSNIRGIMAVGLALASLPAAARAQTSNGERGWYPPDPAPRAGVRVYRGMTSDGASEGTHSTPYLHYGPGTAPPVAGGGTSGFTPYVPRFRGPSYTYRPGVTNYDAYTSGYYATGPGLRDLAPGTTYYLPETMTYGTYRYPGTASYGYDGEWIPGTSTFISPSTGAYVIPRTNFVRQYLR